MPKLKPGTIIPTDEEDKEIIRQAIEEGTLLTDEQLAQMKPISEFPILQSLVKRGRPLKKNPKRQLTIRLDGEIIDFFKARGKGWQTEINDVLQKYVSSKCA
jgi:uncharacterized protein (DUF4415 family)